MPTNGWGNIYCNSFSGDTALASGGGGGFDPDYQAVLDYATTQGYTLPTASEQILQNQLMIDRKSAGLWDKDDVFAPFAGSNTSFGSICWKRLITMDLLNTPTYNRVTGFTGGGTAHINTKYNPSTDAVNYTLNNAGIAYGLSVVGSNYIVGGNPLSNIRSRISSSPDNQFNSAGLATFSGANFSSVGNKYMDRVDSVNVTCVGVSSITEPLASTSVPTSEILIFRLNSIFATGGMSWLRLGAAYDATDISNSNTIMNNYLAAL